MRSPVAKATPMATTLCQHLPQSCFGRPAELLEVNLLRLG